MQIMALKFGSQRRCNGTISRRHYRPDVSKAVDRMEGARINASWAQRTTLPSASGGTDAIASLRDAEHCSSWLRSRNSSVTTHDAVASGRAIAIWTMSWTLPRPIATISLPVSPITDQTVWYLWRRRGADSVLLERLRQRL